MPLDPKAQTEQLRGQITGRNLVILNAITEMSMLLEALPDENFKNDVFIAAATMKARLMIPPNINEESK